MALYPNARILLLPENKTQSAIKPTQVILHSAVDGGGPSSLYKFFASTTVGVESHFFVQWDGTVEQYMDTTVRADCNYKANPRAISIETEDDGDPNSREWSPAQLRAINELLTWCNRVHGIPMKQCETWASPGIGYHTLFPSHWTPYRGKTCPGTIRKEQFPWIVLAAANVPLVRPQATAKVSGRDEVTVSMPVLGLGDSGPHVAVLVGLLIAKFGSALTGRDQFDSHVAAAVSNVQQFFGLTVDGVVGAESWPVLLELPLS